MPTHDETAQFLREYRALTGEKRLLFRQAVREMNEDIKAGAPFRKGLRVSMLSGYPGIFEMTWEYHEGRATFRYGGVGEPDIIWLRIGDHTIYKNPTGR